MQCRFGPTGRKPDAHLCRQTVTDGQDAHVHLDLNSSSAPVSYLQTVCRLPPTPNPVRTGPFQTCIPRMWWPLSISCVASRLQRLHVEAVLEHVAEAEDGLADAARRQADGLQLPPRQVPGARRQPAQGRQEPPEGRPRRVLVRVLYTGAE